MQARLLLSSHHIKLVLILRSSNIDDLTISATPNIFSIIFPRHLQRKDRGRCIFVAGRSNLLTPLWVAHHPNQLSAVASYHRHRMEDPCDLTTMGVPAAALRVLL